MTDGLQLLTVGRTGVDFYAEEPHAGFVEARRFEKSVGGSPWTASLAP